MIDLIVFIITAVIVYVIAYYVMKVLKALYPYRWLILIASMGIAYYIHQEPSLKTYRRVQFTTCNSDSGDKIINSHRRDGMVKLKSKVHVNGVCNELAKQIPLISNTYRRFSRNANYKLTITSAIDGEHTYNSHHYKGRAFDLRVRDISSREATRIANHLKKKLGDNYRIFWGDRGHKDHIHLAYIGSH
jgi:hypothetical protein